MPQNPRGGEGKSSPAATETRKSDGETTSRTAATSALELTDALGARARGKQRQERSGGDDYTAAVAVKIRKGGFFGVFRRPVGGPDDVVHVPVGETCVICMEPFKPNEVLEVLLCQHLYHERCIKRWLGDHTSCCVCKADMEEMARAVRKPSRRRRSRPRSETRSERSESFRSESGYGSDQARSTWSSISAPAALVDRVPPDSGRLLRGAVSVFPTTIRSGRTSLRPGHERAAAARRDSGSHSPMSVNLRPPVQNTTVRMPTRNTRSQAMNRSPAAPTAAIGGLGRGGTVSSSSARSRSREVPPSLRLSSSAFQPEWNLQSSRDRDEHSSSCSSSSSCCSISSINSNCEDSYSRRSTNNTLNTGAGWSNSLTRPSRSPPPVRVLNRSPRRQSLSPAAIRQREMYSRSRSPSSSSARPSAGGILRSPARTRGLPPPQNAESKSSTDPRPMQVLPREFPPASPAPANRPQEWPLREFPSAVAALSTPQRSRGSSQPALSFMEESSLSSGFNGQVTTTLRRQWRSPSTPRSQLQPMSTRSTPTRRRSLESERVNPEASVSCERKDRELDRKVWGERKTMIERDRLHGGIVGARKPFGEYMPRFGRSADESGEKAASISPSESTERGGRARIWVEPTRTMEKASGERHRDEVDSAGRGDAADIETLPGDILSVMAAKPADKWDPMSDSLLPTGKLNGWVNTQEDDEEWLEDIDKTSTSELGSQKTCSTQWSEMESQFSGVESQHSGNSYPGEEASAISALPPRRRTVPALPPSPRQYVPAIAEAKRPSSLSVAVSPAVHKEHEEPCQCRADLVADTPGALTPGALTPGALRARSESAPMIWD